MEWGSAEQPTAADYAADEARRVNERLNNTIEKLVVILERTLERVDRLEKKVKLLEQG